MVLLLEFAAKCVRFLASQARKECWDADDGCAYEENDGGQDHATDERNGCQADYIT